MQNNVNVAIDNNTKSSVGFILIYFLSLNSVVGLFTTAGKELSIVIRGCTCSQGWAFKYPINADSCCVLICFIFILCLLIILF
jgi:hypothetical protein